jgi:hypothetical protein
MWQRGMRTTRGGLAMKWLAGALLAVAIGAQAAAQSTEESIRSVISNQFAAFQQDDFETAFTFASPMIQGMFGTPERFGQMVRQGYPMVWRPADVDFAALDRRGGKTYQNVLVTDQAGVLHLLEYEMVQTEDGWEINGVYFKRPGGAGA